MNFTDFALSGEILRAVADSGYTEPTPIQAQAIPVVLEGGDVMGAAQTGTGKTASFTLPILQLLQAHQNASPSPARHPVRALVLLPTRELALQVAESVANYGKHLTLRSAVVFGGVDQQPQKVALRAGVEILIATPGRLLDHIEQKNTNLSQVQILVLDEADRMLDMGFMPDIKRILGMLPTARQNLLFSATFSDEIKKLANGLLKAPKVIEVARRNATADTVRQQVYQVPDGKKEALLKFLVSERNIRQAIVFSNSKIGTSRLARHLARDGISCDAIHGDKSQNERLVALNKFKAGEIVLLVATDVAARGLDIQEMPCVINYDLPYSPEDYVHRIGRTGRAGAEGDAISFYYADEEKYLVEVEKLTKKKLDRLTIPPGFFDALGDERDRWSRRGARGDGDGGGRERHGDRFERGHRDSRQQRNFSANDFVNKPAADDWFMKPYEAKDAATEAAEGAASSSAAALPRRAPARTQVGALLGGLKKP
jgi:ATP-dependent RNA helicase RhlE